MVSATGRRESIEVEVAYATPARQVVHAMRMAPGATVEQAIRESGVLHEFVEIDLARNAVGVFGRRVALDALLRDGDRVEIYRPLALDPKRARRRRARRRSSQRSKRA